MLHDFVQITMPTCIHLHMLPTFTALQPVNGDGLERALTKPVVYAMQCCNRGETAPSPHKQTSAWRRRRPTKNINIRSSLARVCFDCIVYMPSHTCMCVYCKSHLPMVGYLIPYLVWVFEAVFQTTRKRTHARVNPL